MTRSTLARRYAPLVAVAVLQLLIIGFVPSKAGKTGQQVAAANGNRSTGVAAAGTGTGASTGAVGRRARVAPPRAPLVEVVAAAGRSVAHRPG